MDSSLKFNNKSTNRVVNNATETLSETKYAIDSCFNIPIERLAEGNNNEISIPTYWSYEDENKSEQSGALYTFEEFIQNNSSSRNSTHRQVDSENLYLQPIQSDNQTVNEQFLSSITEDFLRKYFFLY